MSIDRHVRKTPCSIRVRAWKSVRAEFLPWRLVVAFSGDEPMALVGSGSLVPPRCLFWRLRVARIFRRGSRRRGGFQTALKRFHQVDYGSLGGLSYRGYLLAFPLLLDQPFDKFGSRPTAIRTDRRHRGRSSSSSRAGMSTATCQEPSITLDSNNPGRNLHNAPTWSARELLLPEARAPGPR